MQKEIKSKIRHRIQNQLGMAMLLSESGEKQKVKVVKILKIVSALVEILGQFDKDQGEIEIRPGGDLTGSNEAFSKTARMKPAEFELEKLEDLLRKEDKDPDDWPEIKMIRDYFNQPQA